MLFTRDAIEQISESRVEIDLNEDRNSKECDDQRLSDDLLPLKAKE